VLSSPIYILRGAAPLSAAKSAKSISAPMLRISTKYLVTTPAVLIPIHQTLANAVRRDRLDE
ncbi:MAG: hypothetical protein ACTSWI_04930, partial [Alphaproteobacteria bacterium]